MEALKRGGALLPSSRNEIVDSLATIIMTHPSSKQLESVAMRLITTHPCIADKVPGGTAHVSMHKSK